MGQLQGCQEKKIEKILIGSLDSIPSPSPSVKIQIMGRKVCLRCKGKHMFCFPANNLNFHSRLGWWDWIQTIFLNLFYFKHETPQVNGWHTRTIAVCMYSFLLVQGWVILFDATARCHVTLPPLYTTVNHSSQSPQSKAHFHLNESPCHFDCINFAHHFNGTPFYLLLALNPSHNAWWWSNLAIDIFPMGFLILSKTFLNSFFLTIFKMYNVHIGRHSYFTFSSQT